MLAQLQAGNVRLFGGFARSGRLLEFHPAAFDEWVNFSRNPEAATLVLRKFRKLIQ